MTFRTSVRRSLLAATALTFLAAGPAAAATDFASMKVQPYNPPKPAPAFSLPDLACRAGAWLHYPDAGRRDRGHRRACLRCVGAADRVLRQSARRAGRTRSWRARLDSPAGRAFVQQLLEARE